MNKSKLRKELLAKRRGLSASIIASRSHDICQQVLRRVHFKPQQKLAFYSPHNGEVDPSELLNKAYQLGCQCYWPVILNERLGFAPIHQNTRLTPNQFNIPEPEHTAEDLISADTLDILFMPLVGFDHHGNRLGMGKGFYDKTLATLNTQNSPLLIGLAYEFQRVDELEVDDWDVPLSIIITEEPLYP